MLPSFSLTSHKNTTILIRFAPLAATINLAERHWIFFFLQQRTTPPKLMKQSDWLFVVCFLNFPSTRLRFRFYIKSTAATREINLTFQTSQGNKTYLSQILWGVWSLLLPHPRSISTYSFHGNYLSISTVTRRVWRVNLHLPASSRPVQSCVLAIGAAAL